MSALSPWRLGQWCSLASPPLRQGLVGCTYQRTSLVFSWLELWSFWCMSGHQSFSMPRSKTLSALLLVCFFWRWCWSRNSAVSQRRHYWRIPSLKTARWHTQRMFCWLYLPPRTLQRENALWTSLWRWANVIRYKLDYISFHLRSGKGALCNLTHQVEWDLSRLDFPSQALKVQELFQIVSERRLQSEPWRNFTSDSELYPTSTCSNWATCDQISHRPTSNGLWTPASCFELTCQQCERRTCSERCYFSSSCMHWQ